MLRLYLYRQSLLLGLSGGFGTVISPVYQVTVSDATDVDFRLTATEVLFETANPLG